MSNMFAYPHTEHFGGAHGGDLHHQGMTLRDYFAGQAMQAMISKSTGQDTTGGKAGVPLITRYAYEFADAMLKARES